MNYFVKHKRVLTVLNALALIGLIGLYHLGFLNDVSWLVFGIVTVGLIILALYKSRLVFALLVGVIPLEIVSIAPVGLGVNLRPYQLLSVVLMIVLIFRALMKFSLDSGLRDGKQRAKMTIGRVSGYDVCIGIFVILGFVNLVFVQNLTASLKQSLVVLSFGLLYFVVRHFVRTKDDLVALFPILISSAVVVSTYAIIQNYLFTTGGNHVEIMPGRPNAVFAEPDWLGFYLVFAVGVILSYLYHNAYHKHLWKFFDIALYTSGILIFSALIITVARSAWLGTAAVIVIYLFIIFLQKKYKLFAMHGIWLLSVGLLSVIIVLGFQLTNFELFNRAQSTGSGLQEITVACVDGQIGIPTTIGNVSELEDYGCEHINLEEVETYQVQGWSVLKIYRKDPNVEARADVYAQTMALIVQRPLVGYGWGSSGELLGSDEGGTPLNASNILLETVLSIGVIGGGVLIMIFLLAFAGTVRTLIRAQNSKQKSTAIFVMVGIVAIIVPNIFNAGLFLGFVWMFFGMIAVLKKV